ncbi:MAG: hypothetical protein P0111_09770 [Nitrospira sp.]|nr:hypothetical protein [Nitrospira sp.]
MDELEEKASTLFTGKATPLTAAHHRIRCTVDGCLHHATVACEVIVTNSHLRPDGEIHHIPLCDKHAQAGDMLKWEWRRDPDANAARKLRLDALFALDTIED